MSLPSLSIVRRYLRDAGLDDTTPATEISDAVFAYVRDARPRWDDNQICDWAEDLTERILSRGR